MCKGGRLRPDPGSLGKYSLSGSFTALKTYVPDLYTDVVQPLLNSGRNPDEIVSEIGGLETSINL